jgi:hypothetical protein
MESKTYLILAVYSRKRLMHHLHSDMRKRCLKISAGGFHLLNSTLKTGWGQNQYVFSTPFQKTTAELAMLVVILFKISMTEN